MRVKAEAVVHCCPTARKRNRCGMSHPFTKLLALCKGLISLQRFGPQLLQLADAKGRRGMEKGGACVCGYVCVYVCGREDREKGAKDNKESNGSNHTWKSTREYNRKQTSAFCWMCLSASALRLSISDKRARYFASCFSTCEHGTQRNHMCL